jgi:NAD(P)-dependent dehydrogenase (short-subunit alcohol dehydrogenase family)
MNTQGFERQKVLVVGGSSGIGEAVAQAFVEQGASVTIASRSAAKLDAVAKRIGGNGGDIQTVSLDFTQDGDVAAFFGQAPEYDHIVVTAGETPTGPVRALQIDDAYAAMNSKFWGAYRIARGARIREGGSLTLVSGFLSVRPSKASVLQGAINAALEALGRGLALELSPVRVNTVSPGMIATPLWSKFDDDTRTKLYESAAQRLPARRVGQPEDIARAVLYLASTGYATGSTVLVDGGGAIA